MRYFVLIQGQEVMAKIGFAIEGTQAISGKSATFGSIDARKDIPREALVKFTNDFRKQLYEQGIRDIRVRQPALCYPGTEIYSGVLDQAGFSHILSEINQHIIVSNAEYKSILKKNEQKKLNQCIKEGYSFRRLDRTYLRQVYDLIFETRSRKGYPITMTFAALEKTFSTFPKEYMLFGIFDSEGLIAASVTIKLSSDVLYNFYHADHYEYRSRSPLVMLVGGIYFYCQENDYALLDLGISSENGVLNDGLFKFKENLGAEVSMKQTFQFKNE